MDNRRSRKKKFKNVLTSSTLCVILNVSNEREEIKMKEVADLLDADSFCEYLRDRGITKI